MWREKLNEERREDTCVAITLTLKCKPTHFTLEFSLLFCFRYARYRKLYANIFAGVGDCAHSIDIDTKHTPHYRCSMLIDDEQKLRAYQRAKENLIWFQSKFRKKTGFRRSKQLVRPLVGNQQTTYLFSQESHTFQWTKQLNELVWLPPIQWRR